MRAPGLKVRREEAERVLRKLREENRLIPGLKAIREGEYVIFPVKEGEEYYEFPEAKKRRRLRDILREILPPELHSYVFSSYDIIGDIAVVEIPEELLDYKEEIGRAVAEANPHVRTVVRKVGGRKGEYRTLDVEVIWGEPRTETVHREHGCVFKLDVAKVYFSPRLSTERGRIRDLVRDGEVIGALFAGVGPFPIVIAKKKKVLAHAVELNPVAYSYLVENIRLNRVEDRVIPYLGDVREVVPEHLRDCCDRVLMPLPKGAENFLDVAFLALGEEGYIHYYRFSPREDPFSGPEEEVRRAGEEAGYSVEIAYRRIVRPYSPDTVQVVLDVFARKLT